MAPLRTCVPLFYLFIVCLYTRHVVQSQTFPGTTVGSMATLDRVELESASQTCGHPDSGMTSFTLYNPTLLLEIPHDELPNLTCVHNCAKNFDENFSRANRFRIENFNAFGQYHRAGCVGYTTRVATDGDGSGGGDPNGNPTSEYVAAFNAGENFCAIKDFEVMEVTSPNMTFSFSVKIFDADNRHG